MPDVQEGVARLQALLEDSTLPTGLCLQISAWQGTLSPLQRTHGSSEPGKGDNGVGCRPARVVLPMGTVWAEKRTEALRAALGEDPSPEALSD